jgi:hypothetical protein
MLCVGHTKCRGGKTRGNGTPKPYFVSTDGQCGQDMTAAYIILAIHVGSAQGKAPPLSQLRQG